MLQVHVILHRGRHAYIHLHSPGLLTRIEGNAELICIVLHLVPSGRPHLHDVVNLLLCGHSVRIIDVPVRAGESHHLGAQIRRLLADAPCHVAKPRARDGLALNALAFVLQDVFQIVYRAIPRCLRTYQGPARGKVLAGQYPVFPCAAQTPVLAEQIADLPGPHAHVTCRHVHVRPDEPVQRRHERLAEPHDLRIRLPRGIEVAAALPAADGQSRQRVLERLLERQKLDDPQVHVLPEPQSSLVRPDRSVELRPVPRVRVPRPVVRHPRHPEAERPLRLHHPAQQVRRLVLRMLLDHRLQRGEHLLHRLYKLRFVSVFPLHFFDHSCQIPIHLFVSPFLIKSVQF